MTTMEAYITADILITKCGIAGAGQRACELLADARAEGDQGRIEEWSDVQRALTELA